MDPKERDEAMGGLRQPVYQEAQLSKELRKRLTRRLPHLLIGHGWQAVAEKNQ
jgi:hypothetical protein